MTQQLVWRTARGDVHLDRPYVMGILNTTPDSFWDGGRFAGLERAMARAEELVGEGADIIDVGGESTRPGADPVSAEEEHARVVPVVHAIVERWPELLVSVDTVKSEIAQRAIDHGAAIINDVSAFRLDRNMAPVAAQTGAGVVLMHSRGRVDQMARYEMAEYSSDVVGDVIRGLLECVVMAEASGVQRDTIVLDPGLGFSKRTEHSVAVIRELDRMIELGYPLLLGPSRKRFIGDLSGGLAVEDRLPGTIAACVVGWKRGARIFRVHDVREVRRALDVALAL